jgi:hypothetical protein
MSHKYIETAKRCFFHFLNIFYLHIIVVHWSHCDISIYSYNVPWLGLSLKDEVLMEVDWNWNLAKLFFHIFIVFYPTSNTQSDKDELDLLI